MANAKQAPLKNDTIESNGIINLESVIEVEELTKEDIALSQKFDINKKYMFELAVENPERENPVIDMVSKRARPHVRFSPFRNIVFTSQIVWKEERRGIRYYDGCTSIFIDEQPKDKDTIEQLIRQTSKRHFEDGKFGVFGEEKQLLLFLNICSWNGDSPFRTRTADVIFVPLNPDKKATLESFKLDQTEMALQYAREASNIKMHIHANYLGIPTADYDSGNNLTEKEIRAEYRKEALRNSEKFIESYGDKSIEVKYFIDKGLEKGIISNKFNPNKATWGSSNKDICDISGLKSYDAISARLFEFSQTDDGEEFLIQLRAVSE